jgi:hypothetical protein
MRSENKRRDCSAQLSGAISLLLLRTNSRENEGGRIQIIVLFLSVYLMRKEEGRRSEDPINLLLDSLSNSSQA